MGNLDAVILADADFAFDDFGETATYTPANISVTPFTLTVVISRVDMMQFSGFGYADKTEARIRHADLVAGGITEPTAHNGNSQGDAIVTTDLNGASESWEIVAKRPERKTQCWVLEIEKNLRFRP